jgi:hypothetical protein
MSESQITVSVGDKDLVFNAGHEDFNRFINEQMPNDKVGPAYNFLSRTVTDESRDAFKRIALTEDLKPKGMIVLQIAGVITQELGGDVQVAIKKPKASPTESNKTAGDNFKH